LEAIKSKNIKLIPFIQILDDLHTAAHTFSASAGGDLVEILGYYQENAPIVKKFERFEA
jgi:hypothetical protein